MKLKALLSDAVFSVRLSAASGQSPLYQYHGASQFGFETKEEERRSKVSLLSDAKIEEEGWAMLSRLHCR